MSTYADCDTFIADNPCFLEPGQKPGINRSDFHVAEEFSNIFPRTAMLIRKARILDLRISGVSYRLFSWTNRHGSISSWLCKPEGAGVSDIEVLPEHQLLLDTIGGIVEYSNDPEDSFSNNQNFLFLKSECERGLSWKEYYFDMCADEGIQPMRIGDLVSFVREANGSLTLYDLRTGQVYLFSHDHCFGYVRFMEGQPEYTFHYINGVNTFAEYVEALADQWLAHLQN